MMREPSTASVLHKRLLLLFGQVHYMALVSALAIAVCYLLASEQIPVAALSAWAVCGLALVTARGILAHLYEYGTLQGYGPQTYVTYVVLAIATGAVWGVMAGVFVMELDPREQFFCYLVLSIVIGGGVSTLAASAIALYGYLGTALLPVCFAWAMNASATNYQMLMALMVFCAFTLGAARFSTRAVNAQLRLGQLAQIRSQQAEEAAHRLSLTHRATPLAYVEFDLDFRVVEWNPAAETVFGLKRADVLGKHPALFQEEYFEGSDTGHRDALNDFFHVAIRRKQPVYARNQHSEGATIDCEWYCTQLRDDNSEPLGYAAYIQDISARVREQQQIERRAAIDELTGLPNRLTLNDRLTRALERAGEQDSRGALLFINIDDFKQVNDAFGYDEGDEALQELAQRMQQVTMEGEFLARFGGDEFVVLLENLYGSRASMERYVTQRANEFAEATARALNIKNTEFTFGSSMGMALFPDAEGTSANAVLRNAVLALREVKSQTRGRAGFYDDALNQSVREKIEILTGIRKALSNNEFKVFVQPKLSVSENRIIGGEALVRWHQPGRGMVPPGQFIPILEQSPYVYEFGEWILRESLRMLSQWRTQNTCDDHFCLAINVSARQLLDGRFPEMVERLITESGVPGHCIEFEITENVLIENFKKVQATLSQLRELGIQIAIDDFGTGYSSLSYLQRLPVSTVKIDRSFVRDISAETGNTRSIINAILSMGQGLGLHVVAEGVETTEQYEALKQIECDSYQGFWFSPAVSSRRFSEFLLNNKRNAA